ncbi:DMT family transporter [Arachnia propionica]|uniref:DMT family transporter n=1 Tax=Arachnia propionica TaxID=1750 RepID=A0A3P1TCV4_9ACTN|nr:DMT family transporter [Arachnia propionica]RRD07282.1 DMT family transporter [Arachnia propionica]
MSRGQQEGADSWGIGAAALVLLLSATWLLVRLSLTGAPIGITSAGRVGLTTISLWALHHLVSRAPQGDRPVLPVPALPRHETILLSITGVSGYTALSTGAIAVGGPVLPALVMSTSPLVVLLLVAVLERRRPTMVVLLGTTAAVGGTVGYLLDGSSMTLDGIALLGPGLALGAVGCMSCYVIRFARLTRGYHGPMTPVILPIHACGAVPLIVWGGVEMSAGARVSLTALIALVVLGVLVYAPVHLLQHRLLARIGASPVSLLGLAVSPLVAVEAGLLGLAAWPTLLQWAAILVTMLGMAVVLGLNRSPAPCPRRSPSPRSC